ncbi:MAG: tetratricopeptide repeat protein [Planctomycetota bacterium]
MKRQKKLTALRKPRGPDGEPLDPAPKPGSANMTDGPVLFAALLAAILIAALVTYLPLLKHDFVKYDDDRYVTENPRVTGGITRKSVIEAFIKPHYFMWHPLTTLSHTLDCELFGLTPGGHHLTSLLLHLANIALLFWVLKRMTGALWPSAFVTAVFALHPLQVESVAWVSERKNVLSAFFWILTIGTYTLYTERQTILRLGFVILVFALCIMTKPIVVTLPLVLLLLDYWPLRRLQLPQRSETAMEHRRATATWRLLVEKIPLFLLAGALSMATYFVSKGGGVVSGFEKLRLSSRVANAVISYLKYIEKLIWPSGLAVFYPHPAGDYSRVWAVACAVLLVSVTVFFLLQARRRKYLAVGWLWFLGTLVPVIGVVQAGAQARADRYMYVTMIGLLIIIVWTIKEIAAKWRPPKAVIVPAAVVVLAAATTCTRLQLGHWKSSETLFRHALDVTRNNFVMHNNYANLLTDIGRTEEAIRHFENALRLRPKSEEIHNNLANALNDLGRTDDAIKHYKRAIQLEHDFPVAHYNLAGALAEKGDAQGAIAEYRQAITLRPKYVDAWNNLGSVLADQGQFQQAVDCYREAIELRPNFILAHGRLALALARLDRLDEALKHCRIVLKARPDDLEMHCNVGILLEKQGQIEQAIEQYRRALDINPDYTRARQGLDAALAKQKNRP